MEHQLLANHGLQQLLVGHHVVAKGGKLRLLKHPNFVVRFRFTVFQYEACGSPMHFVDTSAVGSKRKTAGLRPLEKTA